MIYTYDIEVFKHDWLVVFKSIRTGEYTVIHNDNYQLKTFVSPDNLYVGFKNNHYYNYIIRAITAGADNTIIKDLNDFIIGGGLGFEHWFLQQNRGIWFNTVDVFDDMQIGLSLKAIECNLGLNVEETSVPFDIDRPLSKEELEKTAEYCKYDVDVTEKVLKLRKDYLQTKQRLGTMKEIAPEKAMYMTNAKLTAAYLGASKRDWNDERNYKYPDNLQRHLIPEEIFKFFDKLKDPKASTMKIFRSKLEIELTKGVKAIYGFGGIHQGLDNYIEKETRNRIIRLMDVGSYYPSLMVKYGYTSRNIPNPEEFEKVYYARLKAKAEGNKEIDTNYKLVLNTTYGAMLNQYNDLFDPLMGRSVCISGQLFLTELVMTYINELKTVKVIQTNTDGVIISFDKTEHEKVKRINREWQDRTEFTLDEEKIEKIFQKDVNNYIIVEEGGKILTKGGYVTYGIAPFGAWNINNNYTIVKKAIIDYFVKDISTEETINNCNDILEFQYIAKASSKYSRVYQIVDEKEIDIQKVNRVYASKDKRNGTLYRVHKETKRPHKIAGLPEHCIIDNRNKLSIKDIDKEHYIQKAKEMVADFEGREVGDTDNQFVNLSDLRKVPGIGEKTMERIRESVEIHTFEKEESLGEPKSFDWLDELLESEG